MKKCVTGLYITLLFALVATLCINKVYAQAPTRQWDNTFGTTQSDAYQYITQLADGSYIIACSTTAGISGDKTTANFGSDDMWLVKVDANGSKVWEKSYGSSALDRCQGLAPASGGGFYIFALGDVAINNTRTAASKGGVDYWVIKCDADGNKIWDKVYGGSGNDIMGKGIATSDGGFLLIGQSRSPISGDKTEAKIGTSTDYDIWVVKVDATGTKQWDKTIGRGNVLGANETVAATLEIADGFVVFGMYPTSGTGGNITTTHKGGSSTDVWIGKLDKTTGAILWQSSIGTTNYDEVFNPVATNDGGFLLPIYTLTTGIQGDKTVTNIGLADYWVVKINSTGTKVWDKVFGGSSDEIPNGAVNVSDGYVIYGLSQSPISGTKSENDYGISFGSQGDMWFIKVDENGNKLWDKQYGSTSSDVIGHGTANYPWSSMIKAQDNSLVFVAKTGTLGQNVDNSFDRTYKSKGFDDMWIFKTQPPQQADLAVTVSPATATGNKGESLSYTVTITNNGPSTAPNATVKVPIPNGRTFLSATPSAGTYSSGTKVWTVGSLANGASATMVITIKVN